MIVDKEAKFKEDVKVLGTARLIGDLIVSGTAKFNGNVKMEGIGSTVLDDSLIQVLVILPNGQVKKTSLHGLAEYGQYDLISCPPGDVPNPHWQSGLNKLTSPCPPVFVGIGTNTPLHRLHVEGVNFSQKFLAGSSGGTTNAIINGFARNNSVDLLDLGIKIDGQPIENRFRIKNDGTVFAKELRIRAVADFPDYVFEEGYKLMSLSDLAEYIKTNSHLPNMPTASEVKAGGLALGDLTVRLVEKVEELTLYTLQLKSENDELKRDLESLRNEVNIIKESINK